MKALKKTLIVIIVVLLLIIVVGSVTLNCLVWNRRSSGFVPTQTQIDDFNKYDKVIIFGIDGAGAAFENCNTPNFDRIFSSGSIAYNCVSQFPTNSAENWTSILHGVPYVVHQINNQIASEKPFTNSNYPSVFKVASEFYGGVTCPYTFASICNWTPINKGIIENDIVGMQKIAAEAYTDDHTSTGIDAAVCDVCINRIKNNEDKIIFMQFDSVDAAGHGYGYMSNQFKTSLEQIDNYLGKIYDACEEQGIANSTLFCLISDHGHKLNGGHGTNSATVRNVTLAINGQKNNVLNSQPSNSITQDVASITLFALGIPQPANYQSTVPYGVFKIN